MTKEQASKKKATRATKPKAKAKAAKPAAEQPEPLAGEAANEQAESTEEKQQEPSAEEKPVRKTKRRKPAKKSKTPAAAGEEPKKEVEAPAEQMAKAAEPTAVQEEKAKAKKKRKSKTAKSKAAAEKEAPAEAEGPEGPAVPAKEAAKAEAEEQKDVQAEVAAEPAPKPKSKPRRKKKKKAVSAPETEVATAEEPAPAPVKEHRQQNPAKKKGTRPEPEQDPRVKRVIIASQNPAKIQAAELGFSRMFPDKEFTFEGVSVGSGVSDQPMSDDETFAGALNRAISARQQQEEGDFWIGLEGGLQEEGDDFFAFAWIVVLGPEGMQGKSRTGTFAIPPAVSELVRNGKELGEADDIVFEQTNSKQSSGAIGILTHGILDRAHYYAEAVLMALIPFKNPSLYMLEEVMEED